MQQQKTRSADSSRTKAKVMLDRSHIAIVIAGHGKENFVFIAYFRAHRAGFNPYPHI